MRGRVQEGCRTRTERGGPPTAPSYSVWRSSKAPLFDTTQTFKFPCDVVPDRPREAFKLSVQKSRHTHIDQDTKQPIQPARKTKEYNMRSSQSRPV